MDCILVECNESPYPEPEWEEVPIETALESLGTPEVVRLVQATLALGENCEVIVHMAGIDFRFRLRSKQ